MALVMNGLSSLLGRGSGETSLGGGGSGVGGFLLSNGGGGAGSTMPFFLTEFGKLSETVNTSAKCMVYAAALTLIMLTTMTQAPYGRYSSNRWGLLLNAKLAWAVQEFPSFFIPLVFVIVNRGKRSMRPDSEAGLALFLMIGHYANRSILYPLRMSSRASRVPFAVFLLAFLFCTWNGLMQGAYLALVAEHRVVGVRAAMGAIIFFIGASINYWADSVFIKLANSFGHKYKIPYGGLFNYISAPHYFGEIIEWTGFAIISNSSAGVAFVLYTIANLVPRALHHHHWNALRWGHQYLSLNRYAIVPFIL